jgi:putative membrane protein
MIDYDPHEWRSHLFDLRGSLLREIFSRILTCLIWSVCVVSFLWAGKHHWFGNHTLVNLMPVWLTPEYLTVPPVLHSMVGFAMGLLLVFRTNSSYDRFWEGRKLWGTLVNTSRNLARLCCVHLAKNVPLRNEIVRWIITFNYSTMFSLRGKREIGEMTTRLPSSEVQTLLTAEHIPLEVSRRITQQLKRAHEQGLVSDIILQSHDAHVREMIDALGACERIHKTPLPFAYIVHLRRALIVYIFTLPFAIYREFGWATILATLIVAFIFFGIEEIGVEIEDPFEGEDNDIPLEAICGTIDRNLSALIGDGEFALPPAGKK